MSTRTIALDEAAWASPWRRTEVGPKVLLSLGLIVEALVLPAPAGLLFVAGASLAILLGPARVPWRVLLRSLAAPGAFIALGAVSVLVSLDWDGGPRLAVPQAGVHSALSIIGHALAGTLAVFVLAATTPMVDLLGWMRRRGVPDALIEISELVYRSLFVLLESVRAVTDAQAQRLGYATRGAALRSATGLMGSLFVRAWTRSQRLEAGLVGRCYDGSLRTLDPVCSGGLGVLNVVVTLVVVAAGALLTSLSASSLATGGF